MKLLTGLFRFARKRTQTTDNDMGMFRDKLDELVKGAANLKDEEVEAKVEELKGIAADLPDSEDKAKLDRFLEDFKSVKEQDEATAKEAASMVSDLFEKLDTEAMKDVPVEEEVSEKEEVVEEQAPEVKEDETKDEDEKAEEVAEEVVEETVAPEGDDAGANAEYTLEEIYQFIKKRMAEDAAACDGAEEVEEAKEEEEEKEEVVTDNACPRIPVTMNGSAARGSLADMFNNIKKGGR